MRALEYPLLADQNLNPSVIEALKLRGLDVASLSDLGVAPNASDHTIIDMARAAGRVILTHDSDFGTLAILQGIPITGIVYLRPGHISSAFVLEMIDAAHRFEAQAQPPFVMVVVRRNVSIRVRLRHL